ncbi:thyroid transcription factor 1-associated protein 26 homolog [Prorops nasuta]|uniref:thyroid transcription factor 1-associated protein 26 homolog n=1 Tax=Prorops nasuta TaxID=863751 RepID=UPI0034CFC390
MATLDKKAYRLKKYSNRFKVEQWKEKRKKAAIKELANDMQKSQPGSLPPSTVNLKSSKDRTRQPEGKQKYNAFFKAKQEFIRKKEEKRKKKEEALLNKTKKDEALKKYKEKKIQAFKKLSKKTKKGQPVMKDRLQMLYEKIQQM